ncbi:MAG: 4-hydroxy-3-methylbut-2-enyl diphosphate reductase [bacterium]|nr:4-hydroxy-3-methylbut-2-enyl diphosphate reductase [bacterium]
MKNIIVAEEQGFCWGVRRALEIVEKHGPVSILGDLIHNKQVVERLEAKGKRIVHEIDPSEQNPLVITAHGTDIRNFDRAEQLDLEVVDTTCPLVAKIYEAGHALEAKGYQIVVIGDKNHVEVKGIASRMKAPIVLNDEKELEGVALPPRVGVVSQSTFSPKKFDKLVELIAARVEDLEVTNTICAPTKKRQLAAEDLAKRVEIMIVIGGFHSSNTKKLHTMAQQYVEAYHVETAEQLDPAWFDGKEEIGIIAGASTPDWIIEEVSERIRTFGED